MTGTPKRSYLPRFLSSLRLRLLLLVLFALIPSLLLIIYSGMEERNLATQQAEKDALRLARLAANSDEQLVEGAHHLLSVLATLPAIQDYESPACSEFLADLHGRYPQYLQFGVTRSDGMVTCTARPDPAPVYDGDNAYFKRVMATRAFAAGDFTIGRLSGKPVIAFGYPLLAPEGEIKAVVFVAMDLAPLNDLAAQALMPFGTTLTAIDRNGIILARYPDPDKWVGHSSSETPIHRIVLGQTGEGTAEALGEDKVSRLYAFTPLSTVPNQDMYVIVGIPTTVAYAEVNRILTRNLIALSVVGMLALMATWGGGEFFLHRPIRRLLEVARRISKGDLKARTGVIDQDGELNELAFGFDQMAQSLQKRESERNQAEGEIRRQAAEAQSLARIAAELNAHLDLDGALNALCSETANLLNAPAASVRLWDEDREALFCAACYGLPPDYARSVHPLPRALVDRLIGQPHSILAIADVRAYPDLPDAALYASLDIRMIGSAGMSRKGQLIGLLRIFSFGEPRTLLDHELTLFEELAGIGALAITNARLYEDLQREEHSRADLLHQVITAQEDERRRIARELHDETSQSLTALMMGLDTVGLALSGNAEKADAHLQATRSIAESMLDNVHRLIGDLRPSLLDDLGLVPAIAWYGERRLKPLGIALHIKEEHIDGRLPHEIETALFRIVQEAMTNVVRHSGASTVELELTEQQDCLILKLCDDGKGFDLSSPGSGSDGKGFGLRGMQERVTILGGQFHLHTTPGQGTTITIQVPFRKGEIANA